MSEMYFEGRELKPWAEYVAARELEEGGVYFRIGFVDENMLVPTLEPLVFIGRDLDPEDQDVIYFQDARSYLEGHQPFNESSVRETRDSPEAEIFLHTMKAGECHLLEYEKAIDVLLQCALRRRSASP